MLYLSLTFYAVAHDPFGVLLRIFAFIPIKSQGFIQKPCRAFIRAKRLIIGRRINIRLRFKLLRIAKDIVMKAVYPENNRDALAGAVCKDYGYISEDIS